MSSIKTLKTGHTVEPVSDENFKRISKNFPIFEGFVRLHPGGWFVSNELPPILDKLHDFQYKDDDALVITYPKSGTTWTQEIVWSLIHNPDLNNPDANIVADVRSPHIELDFLLAPAKVPNLNEKSEIIQIIKKKEPERLKDKKYPVFNFVELLESPRVIKSHVAIDLFPKTMLQHAKVVYVIRDPRDVIVSIKYHFWKTLIPYSMTGTLDEFIDSFINEEQFNHPYCRNHVKNAYDLRDHPNVQIIYFEDLKTNPFEEIKKISKFLGLQRTDKQIQNVVDYTNFKNMKKRTEDGTTGSPMTDGGRYLIQNPEAKIGFFRKGHSGTWKDSFTEEQVNKITAWMDKNMQMFPSDFKYKP